MWKPSTSDGKLLADAQSLPCRRATIRRRAGDAKIGCHIADLDDTPRCDATLKNSADALPVWHHPGLEPSPTAKATTIAPWCAGAPPTSVPGAGTRSRTSAPASRSRSSSTHCGRLVGGRPKLVSGRSELDASGRARAYPSSARARSRARGALHPNGAWAAFKRRGTILPKKSGQMIPHEVERWVPTRAAAEYSRTSQLSI